MAKAGPLASMLLVAVVGCGGGGDDPPDAGPDGARPPDAAPDAATTPTAVTLRVFSVDGVPESNDVALVSDNGGAWQPMTAGATGVYTADVVGPRYAIARGCSDPSTQYSEGWIYYVTLAEATELADLGCHYKAVQGELSGTVTGVAADQRGTIITSYSLTNLPAGATDYLLPQPVGTTDLVARLFPDVPTTQPRPTQRLLIERDLDVAGSIVHDLDFTADGVAPEAHTFDVTGAGGSAIERISSSLVIDGPFGFTLESNREDTNVYHTIPAGLVVAGDRVTVTRASGAGNTSRSVTMVLAAPADVTGAYGPAFSTAAPTAAATAPSVRLAGSLPHVDGADIYEVDAFWIDDTTLDAVNWSQVYTDGYAGAAAIDYEFPDLAGIGDWDIVLPAGEITWTHSVISSASTERLPTFLDIEYVVGDTILGGTTSGTLNF